jgi:hypothetical protein
VRPNLQVFILIDEVTIVTQEDRQLADLAGEYGATAEALHAMLVSLRAQVGADYFYVYWTSSDGAKPAGQLRQRTLLAFLTADAAVAFAQRNRLYATERPRLRRLSLLQLVQATLRASAITAILFATEHSDQPPPGRLPPGARVDRASLLRSLDTSKI